MLVGSELQDGKHLAIKCFFKLLSFKLILQSLNTNNLAFEANVTTNAFLYSPGKRSIRVTIYINYYMQSFMFILKRALSEKFIKNRTLVFTFMYL